MGIFKSNFLKNTGLLFSGSFLAQAVGLAISPVLSRIYSPEDFGGLGLFNSLVAVFMAIAGLRYEMAIVVEDKRSRALRLTQLSLMLNLAVSVILLLIITVFNAEIKAVLNINNGFWLYLTPLAVALTSMSESLVLWHNRAKKYKKITSNRVITSYTSSAYKTAHPFIFQTGSGLIIGQVLGQALGFIHLIRKEAAELFVLKKTEIKELAVEYKHFPMFSMPAALVNILAIKMPFFVLSYFDGTDATGYLENASKLTYLPMSLLAMASSQVFFERIARLKDNKKVSAQVSHQLAQFLYLLAFLPVAVLFVSGQEVITFILGDQWVESGLYVQILILFYFSMFLTSPFSSAFETYKKLKQQLIYNICFLVFTSTALVGGFIYYGNVLDALVAYAIVGTVLRLFILNYFFYLFGKPLIGKTLFGIMGIAGLIWLLQWLGL